MKSKWCRFEFTHAYNYVLEGRVDYIIVVLLDDIPRGALTEELRAYLTTNTYIDAREYAKDFEMIRKRIRFALPKVPLKELKVREGGVHHVSILPLLCIYSLPIMTEIGD